MVNSVVMKEIMLWSVIVLMVNLLLFFNVYYVNSVMLVYGVLIIIKMLYYW